MPLPRAYKKSKNQRMACFRLSESTIDALERLSELSGYPRTVVVEMLILEEMKYEEERARTEAPASRGAVLKKSKD